MSIIPNDRQEPAEGFHYGRLSSVVEKEGPKGEYWDFTVTIEEEGRDNGKELPYRLSLSPAARWKQNEFLDAVKAPQDGSTNSDSYVGTLVKLHVILGSYNERERAEIDGIFPADIPDTRPAVQTPAEDDEIPF